MSEHGEVSQENISEEFQITPLDQYNRLITQYTQQTNVIRRMQSLMRPFEQIHEKDIARSALHRQIEALGQDLGKDHKAVAFDMLLGEGNLAEYGVKVPLIKLPMVGVTFRYDSQDAKIRVDTGPVSNPSQEISTPGGKEIASMSTGYSVLSGVPKEPKIFGDEAEITKWNKGNYSAIIFSEYKKCWTPWICTASSGSPLHSRRMLRRHQLAQDFNLNLYSAADILGHQDYGAGQLFGVEVPQERIVEIAQAMRTSPEKYWLTKDEQEDPFNPEFLEDESLDNLESDLLGIRKRLDSGSNSWRDWFNFLRVHSVIKEAGRGYKTNLKRSLYWDKSYQVSIENAINEAKNVDSDASTFMAEVLNEIINITTPPKRTKT